MATVLRRPRPVAFPTAWLRLILRATWRFPRQHRTTLHSTNPIERLNKGLKCRAGVVGIFPNEASILRLIGAVLFEANDEWKTSSRFMMVEAFALIDKEEIDPIRRTLLHKSAEGIHLENPA